jgi:hypothetical protein
MREFDSSCGPLGEGRVNVSHPEPQGAPVGGAWRRSLLQEDREVFAVLKCDRAPVRNLEFDFQPSVLTYQSRERAVSVTGILRWSNFIMSRYPPSALLCLIIGRHGWPAARSPIRLPPLGCIAPALAPRPRYAGTRLALQHHERFGGQGGNG